MKLTEVIRRYNHAWDAHYAEALVNLFRKSGTPLMRLGAVSVIAVILAVAAAAFEGRDNNAPWYPSLQAFEHYNSGRSHVFTQAEFLGSLEGRNKVAVVSSADGAYPSGYNMSYLNEREAFIQGGSYGDVKNSIGPFVAKIDPQDARDQVVHPATEHRGCEGVGLPRRHGDRERRLHLRRLWLPPLQGSSGRRARDRHVGAPDDGVHAQQLPHLAGEATTTSSRTTQPTHRTTASTRCRTEPSS